jgi:hypothetical protein
VTGKERAAVKSRAMAKEKVRVTMMEKEKERVPVPPRDHPHLRRRSPRSTDLVRSQAP